MATGPPPHEGSSGDAGLHTTIPSVAVKQRPLFLFPSQGWLWHAWLSLMQPPCLCKGWGWRYCHLRDPLRSRNKHCVPSIHSPTHFRQRLPLTALANIHFKTAPATFVCHSAASSITPNCICAAIIFYYVITHFSV